MIMKILSLCDRERYQVQYRSEGCAYFLRFAEVEVLVLFCVLALLWIFRSIPDVGGWGQLFKDAKTG